MLFGLGLLLLLALLAWWQGWFAAEPVYHGRTVTQWLDAMPLYDEVRNSDQTGQRMWYDQRTPEAVAADPALQALLALGSQAVPALRTHLTEPIKPRPWWQQLQYRVIVAWRRFQDSSQPPYSPLPLPRYYSSREDARCLSATLTLLALGTNRGGGLPAIIEEYARLTITTNQRARRFVANRAIDTALTGLPQMRTEIRDAISSSLTHTNPLYRQFATANAEPERFPEEFPRWQPLLMRMAASDQEDPAVRDGAMFVLTLRSNANDAEFMALCAQLLTNRANSKHLRGRAIMGIGLGGLSATNYLPLRVQRPMMPIHTFRTEPATWWSTSRSCKKNVEPRAAARSSPLRLETGTAQGCSSAGKRLAFLFGSSSLQILPPPGFGRRKAADSIRFTRQICSGRHPQVAHSPANRAFFHPGTPVAQGVSAAMSNPWKSNVSTHLQDSHWEKVVSDFRRLCILRRQRRREESEILLRTDLPRSIAEWSRQQPGDAHDKKARLDSMFQTEQRRIEDAWMMQDVLTSRLTEDFLPAICSRVSEEVRKAMAVAELLATDSRSPKEMEVVPEETTDPRVAFDDIPSILDLLLVEPPANNKRRTLPLSPA